MTAPARQWSELSPQDKEAAVRPLVERRLSASRIASVLGVNSRNSIITVMARLKKLEEASAKTGPSVKGKWAAMAPIDKDAAVKAGRLAGDSYSDIEREYGAPHGAAGSVGKRLRKAGDLPNLPGKPAKAAMPETVSPKPGAFALTAWNARSGVHPNDFKGRAEQRAASPGIISRAAAFDPLPGQEPVRLVDHQERQCRWPVEPDTEETGFFFCGAPCEFDQPYCDCHAALGSNGLPERRKQTPAYA